MTKIEHIKNCFTIYDAELPEVVKLGGRGCFDFVDRESDNLLITMGDSWTYGARLDEESDDADFRLQNTFGNQISEQMKADFLNVAVPGINNLWLVEKLEALCKQLKISPYNQIHIVCMFTETGREFLSDFDLDPKYNDIYRKCITVNDVIVAMAKHINSRLNLCRSPNTHIHVFTNYVDNIYENSYNISWLEILLDRAVSNTCGMVGSWVIPKFEELAQFNSEINKDVLKNELVELMDKAQERLNLVYNTGYNYKVAYGHPMSTGHKKFADYFISQILKL